MFTVTFCFQVSIPSTSLRHFQLLKKYNVSFRQSEHSPFTQTCSSGTFSKAMPEAVGLQIACQKFQRCLLQRNILVLNMVKVFQYGKKNVHLHNPYRLEYFLNCFPGYTYI